ncbi:MAG: type II toxin-antitoxin system PemK/MazF family toxin [Aridibacter sp.]
MKRGELYRVPRPNKLEPKKHRIYVIGSRQKLIETRYQTVISAPIYTNSNGLPTEVEVGIDEGLKHHSCIRCDELVSIPKSKLTHFIVSLSEQKINELNQALKIALELK